MVKHNNVVPNAHFRKQWQRRVSVNFNQVCVGGNNTLQFCVLVSGIGA